MHYRSYLLRLWFTKTEGQRNWRISLQDTETNQHNNFTNLEELVVYLQNDINNGPAVDKAEGKSDPGENN